MPSAPIVSDEQVAIPSMASSMINHGFPSFMDSMLSEMIWDHREKIHDIVDAILAQRKRIEGKGRLKKSIAARNSSPEYTLQHPKVTPPASQLRHSSLLAQPSRSNMEDILERRNGVSTYGRQWEEAQNSCRSAVERIINDAKARNLKYFDESFYFDRRENLYPDGTPADCSVSEPKICCRLQELYPQAVLFADHLTPDDITQGEVGDCFLIGAVSALVASDAEHIRDLFILHDVQVGVYGLVFYKCGGWEWVIVDDFVPVVKERSGSRFPLFASSTGVITEIWPMILEKAYAKMHYNWSIVDGGWAKEALIDMTGGIATTIDFTQPDSEIPYDKFLQMAVHQHTILACAVPENVKESNSGAAGRAGETSALFGLFKGHQYAVIDGKQTSDGVGFVQCRNPWGNEAEWKGPYSDGSAEWSRNLKHKRELNPTFADDGEFWMRYNDFKKYLGVVDIVTTFPDEYNIITMFGQASADLVPENTYVLNVCNEPLELAITLSQDDPKIKYGKEGDHERQFATYASLKFTIYKMKEIPDKHEDIRDFMQGKIASKVLRERGNSMTQRFVPGAYIICPTVQASDLQDALGIFLRIIGPPNGNFSLHRPYEVSKRTDLSLTVGKCPPVAAYKGRGPEILAALSSGMSAASTTTVTSTTTRAPSKPPVTTLTSTTTSINVGSPPQGRNKAAPLRFEASAMYDFLGATASANSPGTLWSASYNDPAAGTTEAEAGAEPAAEDAVSPSALFKELQDSKDYVAHLEALLKRQQSQIDSLSTQLTAAKAASPLSAARPAATVVATATTTAAGRIVPQNKASTAPALLTEADTAWNRLGISKSRLEELIHIVFMELGNGRDLTVEDAVNGVRLLVTTGTGLDDVAYAHPLCMEAGTARLDVAGFAKLCNDSIMKWEALNK